MGEGLVSYFVIASAAKQPRLLNSTFPAKAGSILILRQAQDEEEGSLAGVPLFLMLSLSKHEEGERPFLTTQPPKITIKTTKPQKVLPLSR